MTLTRLLIAVSCSVCCAPALLAQSPSPTRAELGIGVTHFPLYVSNDVDTRRTGPTLELRLRVNDSPYGVDVAYGAVRQSSSMSSAPRLDVVRVGVSRALVVDGGGHLVVLPAVGLAWLGIRAPDIDCGDFPLCHEWGARDASIVAPVLGLGVLGRLTRHWGAKGAALGYLPIGTWRAGGWQSLREVRLSLVAIL